MNIPRQSIIYLAMCVGGVLLFVFLGIIPGFFTLKTQDRKIQEMKFDIEQQRALFPLYQSAKSVAVRKEPIALPMPVPSRLEHGKINTLPDTIRQIAANNNMSVVSVTPDLAAVADEGRRLSVEVTLAGKFLDLRQFMIDLSALPYMEGAREIRIEQGVAGQLFKMKLIITLA